MAQRIAASLLCALLIACGTSAQSQEQSQSGGQTADKPDAKPTENQKDAAPDIRGTRESPFVVETLPAAKNEEQAQHERYEHYEKPTLDRWLSGASVVLAVVTTALAVFTYFLWGATRKLVIEAKDTARKQLRAYVHVQRAQSYRDETGALWANVRIKNFGQTPAHNVVQWIRIVGVSKGDTPNISYPTEEDEDTSVGIIAPGGWTEFFIPLLDEMTSGKNAALKAGRATVYVWGEIKYFDVFGAEWYTKFRMFLSGEGAAEGRFKTDREGNKAT